MSNGERQARGFCMSDFSLKSDDFYLFFKQGNSIAKQTTNKNSQAERLDTKERKSTEK